MQPTRQEIDEINSKILELQDEGRNQISDGYHTFGELYEHRCVLYIALVNLASKYISDEGVDVDGEITFIKSKTHFDGTSLDGWFIVQGYIDGQQISYHLPNKYWGNVKCPEFRVADNRDGHTSQDVLNRLLTLY